MYSFSFKQKKNPSKQFYICKNFYVFSNVLTNTESLWDMLCYTIIPIIQATTQNNRTNEGEFIRVNKTFYILDKKI